MDNDKPGRHRWAKPPRNPYALPPRAYASVVAVVTLGLLLSGSFTVITHRPAPAAAAVWSPDPADLPPADPNVVDVLRPEVLPAPAAVPSASLPPASPIRSTRPQPGEGMVSIVTRVCGAGAAGTWRANAQANGITAPLYRVGIDATLTIDCEAAVLPPDPTETQRMPFATPSEAPAPLAVGPVVGGWANPLPGACNVSGFRTSQRPGHNGIDLPAGTGTPIYAAAAGTVSTSYQAGGAGNYTVIDHGGVWTIYMHQSAYEVTSGWVEAGQAIGYVGSTGDSRGPHLHLEVQTGLWSSYVDPIGWFGDRGIGWGWC